MKKTATKRVPAETIARKADAGKDVSHYFTNKGKMMPAIQRVNVDFTQTMIDELDQTALELNISRQAVIKTFVRQALDQYHLARNSQNSQR